MEDPLTAGPIIEFRNAAYRTRGLDILHNLNLQVLRGETLVLLGRSGSGKTTTRTVEGRSTREWAVIRLRRSLGYALQDVRLEPHFTVERYNAVVPRLENWPPGKVSLRVKELLQLVGLDPEIARRHPRDLSGGQRQRVGVARALAADPPILLMDEPFGALDPITRAELQREFLNLQRRLNKTVVFVTHDLNEALVLGTRIALMEQGRMIAIDSPQRFLRSREPAAAAYIDAFDSGFRSQLREGVS